MPYIIVPKFWKTEPCTNPSLVANYRDYAVADESTPTTLQAMQYELGPRIGRIDTVVFYDTLSFDLFASAQDAFTALIDRGLRQTHEVVVTASYSDASDFRSWTLTQDWHSDRKLPHAWRSYLHPYVFDSGRTVAVEGHRSTADPDQIAYFPTWDYILRRTSVRTTPSRYLKRFYPDMDQARHDQLVGSWKADSKAFLIATSPEDIVKAYTCENGIDSCMSHALSCYSTGSIHPVEAYGYSDLALAYMGDLITGEIYARAIVHVTSKYFVRVYGDINTLTAALREAGYSERDSFEGARIRRLKTEQNQQIAPYLDGDVQNASGDGDWLVVDPDGEYDCTSSNGIANDSDRYGTCQRCDRCLTENDDEYCESCEEDRINCVSCENRYNNDDMNEVNDEYYCNSCYNRLPECPGCEERFILPDLTPAETIARIEDRTSEYCLDCTENGLLRVCLPCDNFTPANSDTCECCGLTEPRAIRCDRTLTIPFPTVYPTVTLVSRTNNNSEAMQYALEHSHWAYVADDHTHVQHVCKITTCQAPHRPGALVFAHPSGKAYCVTCAHQWLEHYHLDSLLPDPAAIELDRNVYCLPRTLNDAYVETQTALQNASAF